ncbi:transglycosylase domain-containing protein [Lacrimispora xylanolytica]|uniref:Penicillin-binding protein 1A n=1 Tax=Lacrimispora xylanolytica TaxID=29375 RepID=A0ABY7A863_9FIRM|nr:transglycosylase domain-containing protein [Lacrimispora xylanolytica]WAJ22726.1 transglycosylase domain-containing protein [Lacrimispora xylanolytica]
MKKQSKKKKTRWSVFLKPIKVILFTFLAVMVLGCLAGGAVFLKYQDEILACKEKADSIMSKTSKTDFSQPTDTRVYDSSGTLIGTINSGHYEYVPITGISENLQNAYVAQEDRRFYKHHGIDYQGLLRAGLVFIKNKGVFTQGGSTITQQVIKNTYLSQERTFQRKLTEFFAAPQMEKKYTKPEILEFYCNTNFYANRCYGVSEASRYYFDKEAKDLTIWEAATLAGISNNPSKYDPVAHPEASQKKRNQIINSMAICKFITEEESENAKAQPITVAKIYEPGMKENYQTSYAIHAATLELMKNDGFVFKYVFNNKASYDAYKEQYQEVYQTKSDMIRNGGFEIHTSLNTDIQNLLQGMIDDRLKKFKEVQENGKLALQGAAVCVDNRTGYVVAIVGGRGTDDEYNRGFLSRRQPGSTIKPLIDYAPAFESGFYYPSRLVNDNLFDKGPKNSGGKYFGPISVREALNRSLNTVAWQVLADIGVDKGIGYLGKMHFNGLSYLDNGNTSMSIGGFTEGARVVDMAKGYAVLANKGMYSSKSCITSIQSQYDGEIYNQSQADERIFTEDTAYMITDVLKGTLDKPYGTGYGLGLTVPAAGKTGTTNSNKDTWFCGYTKYYTTAIWVGYDTPKAMPGVYGKTYSGRIWHDFMAEINKDLPALDWDMPATVSLSNVDSIGEKTDKETGRKDLFSSVAEAAARADAGRWQQEEERKKLESQSQKNAEAAQQSQMAADQAAAAIQTIINEFNGLQYRDSTTDEKINTAHSLLDQLAGTEYYDSLSPQLEAAINRVMSLPKKEESGTKPQEVGPGVTRPSETTTPVFPGDMEPGGGDGPDQGPDGSDYGPIQVEPGM